MEKSFNNIADIKEAIEIIEDQIDFFTKTKSKIFFKQKNDKISKRIETLESIKNNLYKELNRQFMDFMK